MRSRLANLTTFLLALAAQVAFVWQDPGAGLGDKIAASLVAFLGLSLSKAKLAEVEQITLAASTAFGTVLTLVLSRLSPASKWVMLGSVVLATVTSLRVLLERKRLTASAGVFVGVLLAFSASGTACRGVMPDQFLGAVVDCAQVNPQASAALGQAELCFVAAIGGNPAACLAGLVTGLHFTVDEVACVVAYIAESNQAKVAKGTFSDDDLRLRQQANDWLVAERISIRNSYAPAR